MDLEANSYILNTYKSKGSKDDNNSLSIYWEPLVEFAPNKAAKIETVSPDVIIEPNPANDKDNQMIIGY